jgi:hypothetical protein
MKLTLVPVLASLLAVGCVFEMSPVNNPDGGGNLPGEAPDGGPVSGDDAGPDADVVEPPEELPEVPRNTDARYWVGGDGDFSDANHWSEASGGDGGASAPGIDHTAYVNQDSGAPTITVSGEQLVAHLTIAASADPTTTLEFQAGASLACAGNCIFSRGRIRQATGALLRVGENLDTGAVDLAFDDSSGLSIYLEGTGYWRYGGHYQIWNLLAAQPGHTTTLTPIADADDIDVANQVFLGDDTGTLDQDLSQGNAQTRAILEIHMQDADIDIVASGARIAIYSIQHELLGQRTVDVQTDLDLSALTIYDVTGSYGGTPGTGPTWVLNGPLDLPAGTLLVEKTGTLDLDGHDVTVDHMRVGSGSDGTGDLVFGNSNLVATGNVFLGSSGNRPGRIYLDTGSLSCTNFGVGNSGSYMTGSPGSTFSVSGGFNNGLGATLDLDDVTTLGL